MLPLRGLHPWIDEGVVPHGSAKPDVAVELPEEPDTKHGSTYNGGGWTLLESHGEGIARNSFP